MRLLICAGGTGGGVYPALAVLDALKRLAPDLETLWVGGEGGMEEELIRREEIPFQSIPAAGVHGVGLRALPGNLTRLARGVRRSSEILRRFQPDALFFTGGYVAAPMALAGRRIPSLLYVPDIEPGMALKTLAHFSTAIAVTAEESRQFFSNGKNITVTGYPVRESLAAWTREDALRAFDLREDLPTLLVFGGSKGARSINRALLAILPALLEETQVLHISGKLDWEEVSAARESLSDSQKARYHAFDYLHEKMGAALAAADIVLSRAGASTLGEFPRFGIPAILVPYPYAWRYQKVNARYLESRGAALLLEDEALPEKLLPTLREILQNSEKRASMRQAMKEISQPRAAEEIGTLLLHIAGKR
jgi:UDP-N-acetylglucosamine--N-acetylmuramyl-(pentapeptide) pyrophosphoryl-undecaprenol N-acetylglucosamine transferase